MVSLRAKSRKIAFIRSIRLENFKAFKDSQPIPLTPITILIGKNSAGKSSILKAILASSQTASSTLPDGSDFRLIGDLTNLGTFSDTIHGGDPEDNFAITFEIGPPPGWRNAEGKSDHNFSFKYSYSSSKSSPLSAKFSGVVAKYGNEIIVSGGRFEKNPTPSVHFRSHEKRSIGAKFNSEIGEIELFEIKTVVETVTALDIEIGVAEAQETLDPDAQLGDELLSKLPATAFGRIAAQVAKQSVIQKVREAERELIYNEFKNRKGELFSGIVQRIERRNMIVNLGRTDAVLPEKEQIPWERYRQGDRIRAYILDVDIAQKGPQIVLSRTHPGFLIKLFEQEASVVETATNTSTQNRNTTTNTPANTDKHREH